MSVVSCSGDNWRGRIASQEVMSKEPKELRNSIAHSSAKLDIEDAVELLQSLAFSLGQEQQHETEADNVPSGIPPKGALGFEGSLQTRPGYGQNEVEQPGLGIR